MKRMALWVVFACLAVGAGYAADSVTNPPIAGDPVVYVTNTGEKYHNDGCQYLRKSKKPLRLSEAKDKGYLPCSVCKPPK